MSKESDKRELFSYYNENLGDYIAPKSTILVECKSANAVKIMVKHLQAVPNYENHRDNIEFILMTCKLIENLGIKKIDKLSKKEVFIEIFTILFGLIGEDDMQKIQNIVEFLLSKKLVRFIPIRKKVIRFVFRNAFPSFFF